MNEKGCFISSFFPHIWIKVHVRPNLFICPSVNKKSLFLHLRSYLSLYLGRFGSPFVCLCLSGKTQFMISFFLISLGKGIPILNIIIKILISTNEWFFFIDSDDLNDLNPLICNITFLIFFDDSGLNMIIIIDSISHLDISI